MSVDKRDEVGISPAEGGILVDEKNGLHIHDTETSSLEHHIEQ